MTRTGYFLRLAASIVVDVLDASFGRIPIFGSVGEGLGAGLMYLIWGPAGLAYAWELVDVTEQIDGFVPTATLIGLVVGWRNGMLLGRKDGHTVQRTP